MTIRITLAISLIFGMLSALSTSAVMLMILRTAFGIGVGGCIPSLITLIAESSPPDYSATSIAGTQCMFAIGGIYVSLVATGVLQSLGWAWLVFLAALPLVVCLPFYIPGYVHESPVWLFHAGHTEKAERVMKAIRDTNGDVDEPPAAAPPAPSPAKTSSSFLTGLLGGGKADEAVESPPASEQPAPIAKRSVGEQLHELFVTHGPTTVCLLPTWFCLSFGYGAPRQKRVCPRESLAYDCLRRLAGTTVWSIWSPRTSIAICRIMSSSLVYLPQPPSRSRATLAPRGSPTASVGDS